MYFISIYFNSQITKASTIILILQMNRSERLSHFPKITQLVYGRPSNWAEGFPPWRPMPLTWTPHGLPRDPHMTETHRETGCTDKWGPSCLASSCKHRPHSWTWLWLICSWVMHFSKGTSGESVRRGDSCIEAEANRGNGHVSKPLLIISYLLSTVLRAVEESTWRPRRGSVSSKKWK